MKELCGYMISEDGPSFRISKPGFEMQVGKSFLRSADYAELRRLELIIYDLVKKGE